jgi:phosphonate transport system permease protein
MNRLERGPFTLKNLLLLLLILPLSTWSAHRTGLDNGIAQSGEAMLAFTGVTENSQVASALTRFLTSSFPPTFDERIEAQLYDGAGLFPRHEQRIERYFDAESGQWKERSLDTVVLRGGYLFYVVGLMLQTIEIAFWGTLLALCVAAPLALGSMQGFVASSYVRSIFRALSSMLRSIPELISALFFVLILGFGAPAGIVALALHSAGFLGKFFADDAENTDQGPADAFRSAGTGRLSVFRHAILPQVLPQYLAYLQYILERNVRTATVLGIVGAGGIGMELKGRWDLSDFSHVSTILIVIFLTVLLLEHLTQDWRRRIMQ